jgi:hypothetical protein
MKNLFSVGDSVYLEYFNGLKLAPLDVDENENFWKLVGQVGKVLSITPPRHIGGDRLLVRFDANLDEFELPNHNEIPNSLWIKSSDLSLVKPRKVPQIL